MKTLVSALLASAALAACGGGETSGGSTPQAGGTGGGGGAPGGGGTVGGAGAAGTKLNAIPAEAQRTGDAAKGYDALVQGDYVSCGIPWTAYAKVFGPAPKADQLPGRTGKNATLPYNYTSLTTKGGVEIATANCLQCHAAKLNGALVIGLGSTSADYTQDVTKSVVLAKAFLTDPKELAELDRFVGRMTAIGPYTQTLTVGVNPADNLAAVLFAHRDPVTLAWSDTPLLDLPPAIVVPVDVPPWWNMKKKNAMFYVAAGRGDHARTMMAASTLCTDSVEEANAIDAYMPDIRSYLLSLTPPKYPYAIDATLAASGKAVFESTCATCHGTYGEGGAYPNVWISSTYLGTDDTLATGASQFAGQFVDWFAKSFYGEVSRLEPQKGYVAPPLDGIWATAPYFHNGSVPTLAGVLDSASRPTFFTRSYADDDFDQTNVGWNFTLFDHGQDDEGTPAVRVKLYDTTKLGYGNRGHTFGDALSAADRAALIEYLKAL